MEIIDGIKVYAPEKAFENDGFMESGFELLFESEEQSFWFRTRNKIILHLYKKFGPKVGAKFLEIGCGTGYVLNGFRNTFSDLEITGSEIFLNGLKLAKKRMPEANFIQLDATNIPFREVYDAIGAFDVIEHIDDDQLVLQNCYKALKSKGYLFISVPQYRFMWSYLDEISYHKRRYSKNELIQKVREAGFETKFITSFIFVLFPAMVLSRLIKGSGKKENTSEEVLPGKVLNSIFYILTLFDVFLVKLGISLPWGGSLILVARKP
jgi:SAM-dependent methyltransferase